MPNSHVGAPHRIIDLDEDPLSTRCWAFQERYLSPRTLHFAQVQMYFECESCFEAQEEYTEPVGHPQPFDVPKREGTELDERQMRVDWNFMVARYTQRYITMDSDKLPALGGLAARVALEPTQQGLASEYLAGLWKNNIFCDLFWLALDHESKRKEPSSYSAPSWSWASVNHPVHYHYHDESESLAILRDAKVNLENDESPFGKVTGGWIHLSAVMINPCTVDERNRMFFLEQDSRLCIKVQWDPPKYGLPTSCLMDYVNKLSDLVAVPLYWVQKSNDPIYNVRGPYYLILTKTESNLSGNGEIPQFRRVGAGSPDITGGSDVQLNLVRAMFARDKEQGKLVEIIIV